jgi:hypothetical protein
MKDMNKSWLFFQLLLVALNVPILLLFDSSKALLDFPLPIFISSQHGFSIAISYLIIKDIMNSFGLLLILVLYLSILFLHCLLVRKRSHSKWTNNPISISLAVYCTAWTYYGSIGVAAESGLNYLPIYLGPILIIPTWMIILKELSISSK